MSKVYDFGITPGPVCCQLYHALHDIQFGRAEDTHSWNMLLEDC